MRYLNLISHIALLLTVGLVSGCASKATRAFEAGEKLEAEGKYEEAMYSYAESFKNDPTVSEPRIRFFKNREKSADLRFRQGKDLSAKGDYVNALKEFQTAQGIDPTEGRYVQQIELATRYKDAQLAFQEGRDFEKGNKLKDAHRQYLKAVELLPGNKEYQDALERILKLRKSKVEGYELRLKSNRPITLKFKEAKMKDVFSILTQLSGINFVFDEGIKDSPVSIYIENASFQQALDLLTNMNKLSTKNLNETTTLVYANSPDKNKQYDDMILRTFHLNYMDAKKAINLIRTMVQVRKAYVNEDSNSIVIRDTEDIVAVVEKILDANDQPEAEVVLDVEVIEISDKNTENLGLLLDPYKVQLGAFTQNNVPYATSLATKVNKDEKIDAAGVTNLFNVFNAKKINGYVTIPNATFNFTKTLANGEVLSNPKIRVKNKEKAKFNAGTRVPITTTTLNGQTTQVNVQYIDVGVKVSAEPTIQLNNEISIKLSLEVSSIIGSPQVVGGTESATTVVTIGTRNIDTVLSLKDNETSVIGGLIQRSNTGNKNKLLLLSDIPLIGPLFTNTDSSKDKSELLLAITPRLVRGIPVPLPGLASFGSGKEDHPSLVKPMSSFDLEPVFDEVKSVKPSEKKNINPALNAAVKGVSDAPLTVPPTQIQAARPIQPVAPVAPVAPVTKVAPVAPLAPVAPVAEPPDPSLAIAPAVVQRSFLQMGAPSSVIQGQQFTLDIKISDVKDLANTQLVFTYDPVFVDFVAISEGAFLKKDGKATTFSSSNDSVAGTVKVTMGRSAGTEGVVGEGVLATATFRAKNQGAANFSFSSTALTSSYSAALDVLPFSTAVDIR